MKIQLSVSDKFYKDIEDKLRLAGFEIDDDGPFLLSEKERFPATMLVKDDKGEKVQIDTSQIVYIESFGHSLLIHTTDGGCYNTSERLYQVEGKLDDTLFLRVSNCAIIAKNHVKKIKPAVSMKFVLTMSDGGLVDVTRSYYNTFRQFFGI